MVGGGAGKTGLVLLERAGLKNNKDITIVPTSGDAQITETRPFLNGLKSELKTTCGTFCQKWPEVISYVPEVLSFQPPLYLLQPAPMGLF